MTIWLFVPLKTKQIITPALLKKNVPGSGRNSASYTPDAGSKPGLLRPRLVHKGDIPGEKRYFEDEIRQMENE